MLLKVLHFKYSMIFKIVSIAKDSKYSFTSLFIILK